METGLADRGVLVTGGAGGIGSAICRAFAAEGARVAVHFYRSAASAEALANEIGGVALGADLRVEEDADGLIPAAAGLLGRLDVCVANAGRYPVEDVPVWDLPLERWEATLASNLTVTFLTARAFLRHGAETGVGALVLVGSTAGAFGEAGHSDYAAAKGAIGGGLLLSLKNEAARIGGRVRVNAVCPGWVATPERVAEGIDPGSIERAVTTMALKKLATPEDVAAQVVVLASERLAGHLSGQAIVVAGGMEGRPVP